MTKKTNATPNIEETLSKRQALESEISAITSSLNALSNLPQLGIAAAAARSKAESYLQYHGNGDKFKIPAGKQAEYARLVQDAEDKTRPVAASSAQDKTLRAKLAELKNELENLDRTATVADVKKYQAKVSEIGKYIEELKQAVLSELDKVAIATTEALDSLCREREDLLADMAMGNATDAGRMSEIEALITEETARISEAKKAAEVANRARAGLQRKISEAEQRLAETKKILEKVRFEFLVSEAEREGAIFTELSEQYWEQFSRLIALGTMIEGHPAAKGVSIISGYCRSIKLPMFNLKSCPDNNKESGVYRTFNQLDISAATDAVRLHFTKLGIK